MAQLYDDIGRGYREARRADPRIALQLDAALGSAASVVNVGAGSGSYEPTGRELLAIEPAWTMLCQRGANSAPAVQASATQLPLVDACFDAALAILTLHHWPDWRAGVAEMRRVSRGRVVVLSWDPSAEPFWLGDYFPEIWEIDRRIFPSIDELSALLGTVEVQPVLIPHDCTDGFLGAYWQRPDAYLLSALRAAISTFSKIGGLEAGLDRLRADLESGEWESRNGFLRGESELDLGYRLIHTKA